LQNHLREKKSQYLMAAASALPPTTSAEESGSEPDAFPDAARRQPLPTVIPLSELERRAIMNALEYTKGDRAVAAHLLGIGRTTLYRKLKEYQLVP
jgi:DNA-binding NtrC family response regulator